MLDNIVVKLFSEISRIAGRFLRPSFVIICVVGGTVTVQAQPAEAKSQPEAGALMQFTAGGHVLGFQRSAVYIAAPDHALKVDLVGSRGVDPVAEQQSDKQERAPALSKVTYPNAWDGITVTYEASASGIVESNYRVEPGAAVERIHLRYNVPVEIDSSGGLVTHFPTGTARESAPIAWQEISGKHVAVNVKFRALAEREVGFVVGAYDASYPLVIDPTLEWNTFLGGTGDDLGRAIALDTAGNVYVTGGSHASWQPPETTAPVRAYLGNDDAFVAKLNSSGAMQWYTFLGSSGTDEGYAIAVDQSGNVYVAGSSSASWGAAPVSSYSAGADAFLAKLNGGTGALVWNTFLGGSGTDYATGVAVDNANGLVYVLGTSTATWTAPVTLRSYTKDFDAFVAKLNANTGALQWNTFLGGSGNDQGIALALDGSGNVLVVGTSEAIWQDGTTMPVRGYTALVDTFVVKLTAITGAFVWYVFLGGSGSDYSSGIAVDKANGLVYVVGTSTATWTAPSTRRLYSGNDAFVAKLNGGTGALVWNTFLGGSGNDLGGGIALDASGNIYVSGSSNATWQDGTMMPVRPYAGDDDAFAVKLTAITGDFVWNTFLGGSLVLRGGQIIGLDRGDAIGIDVNGNVYVAGHSDIAWQGATSPVRSYSGGYDAFVAKLSAGTVTTLSSSLNPSVSGQAVALTGTVSPDGPLVPTGTVTFGEPLAGTTLGSAPLDASAHATFTTSTLSIGFHKITAVYGGDANFDRSESAVLVQTVNTPDATPTPAPTPAPALLNISTRMEVLTGEQVLIAGFIVTGTEPKQVLLRGLGPELPLAGTLSDPLMELHNSTSSIFTNDNWKDTQQAQIAAIGIPPTNDLESAIVATLDARPASAGGAAYTAVVRGNNDGTGIGQVEVYDLAQNANSKLANISTRGFVDTGDNVMIGGLIIGNGAVKVLVRAIGPSLPVNGALADPSVELRDANAAVVEANDNWVDSPNKQAIIDSTIPPSNDLESAIVRTLPSGNYTAIVSGGVNGHGTGVALVEVYALN